MASISAPFVPRGFEGIVFLDQGLLKVKFRYSKRRFAAIAAIKGAKYNREEKLWQLPLSSLGNLKKSRYFLVDDVSYDFSEEEFREISAATSQERTEALKRIAADPFAVSDQDIRLAQPDLVFRQDRSHRLIVTSGGINPPPVVLTEHPGVFYVKSARGYLFPTADLAQFLKRLRDQKITFAVEHETGDTLKRSASIRAALIEDGSEASSNDLTRAGLMPFVSEVADLGDVYYKLNFWTAEHLKLLMPDLPNFAARKKATEKLSIIDLLKLKFKADLVGIKIWFTGESDRTYQSQIKSLLNKVSVSAAVPDYLLTYMPLSICWFVDHKDRPGLLLNRMSILEDFNYSEYFSEFNKEPSPLMPYGLFLTTTPTKIFEIYLQIKEADSEAPGKIRISKSFENWVHKTQAAQGLLLKAKRYRGLKDYQLNLNNSELEQKLFPHQRVGVAWLLENKFAFLGDDMGLGKTLTVLTAFDELRTKGQSKFLLLIAPASLVKNWMREQVRWVPQLKLCACPDNKKDREALLSKIARDHTGIYDGLVINYEAARIAASAERLREIAESRDVFLCLDESQRIKNARSVGFKSIAHFALACSRRVLLSGTPTPKDISDIWSQYYVLDGGERFGSNFYDWLNSIAVLGNRWSDFAVKTFKPEAVAKVKDQAQELLLRRRKNEVVDLPEKIYSIRDVELKAEQFKRYEELRQDLLVRVTRASGAEFYKEISGILEEYLRAVQIASNPRLVDPNWKGEPAKFLELDEIVNEVVQEQGQKLVIWTNFLVNVAELTKRYAAFGAVAFSGEVSQVDRDRAVQEFQSDSPNSPKVLVAVPAAGGVGITLTAAQTAVYVDKTWNAEHWMQSVDRIHRIGQTGVVNIISLHATKVDEVISISVYRKQKGQAALMGDLRESREDLELEAGMSGQAAQLPSREELLAALKA